MSAARIVFAGSPDFAVPVLQALLDSEHRVVAVYTQPDRGSGRGRRRVAGPVKRLAERAGVAIEQPQQLREEAAIARLRAYRADLMVVVAYGLLLPPAALAAPRLGCVNVHASLLPRWRGAAPIQRAIEAGDRDTGVCIMQMEAGLDTGPVWRRACCPIAPEDTAASLHEALAALGAQTLMATLAQVLAGAPGPEPQGEDGVCYAHKLHKAEGLLDWRRPADELARQVRAYDPFPVAHGRLDGELLRIWAARAIAGEGAAVGAVVAESAAGIAVQCGRGRLSLQRVQSAGGRPLAVADFLNGRSLAGRRFELPG